MTETAEVDICEDTIFTTRTEVILDEPSNVIPCTDTSVYEWKADKICEIDVVINDETVDGTPIDCNAIPIYKTTDDFTLNVKYIYTVTNIGSTTENINSLSRTLNVNIKDLTSALDTTELVPVDDVATTGIVPIGICQEKTKLSVSAEVDATSPSGTMYEDTDAYEFDVENICDVHLHCNQCWPYHSEYQ